ncbi:MAG: aminopeptidase P family protein [Rhodospirillales bacterium]|nr:aminopeptidase P family protein [Rhodospirillales bacterium]
MASTADTESLTPSACAFPGGDAADVVACRMDSLRRELRRRRLAGLIVPHADEHQNEQLPPASQRLAWLTGFGGSAGTAVVLRDSAALFVDGRYTVQAALEVNAAHFEIRHLLDEPAAEWISEHLPQRGRLGFDPWLHTTSQVERYRAACRKAGGRLVALEANLIDLLWTDRPPPPLAPIIPYGVSFAGQAALEKRRQIADGMVAEKHDAVVVTAPDSVAWLLNVRGGDVPYTPAPLAVAIVHGDASVEVFTDPRKASLGLDEHLGADVNVRPPEALGAALDHLGEHHRTVRFDADLTPFWIVDRLHRAGARTVVGPDPCVLPKAIKNSTELAGMRAAHRRDGAALTRFLAWLDRMAPSGALTESAAAEKLESFRREAERFCGNSFATISAAGGNGAIVHYRVTAATDRRLEPGSLYLVDSGGQYLDGTTDVTRTVVVGRLEDAVDAGVRQELRDRFTRVLKGHIAIATACFPAGTTGSQLDVLARQALWRVGLDYDHGTGHGVGAYLNVHEGPQRISKIANKTALRPGMIISNEPGYYKTGAYGIRIENLVAVTSATVPSPKPASASGGAAAATSFLGFETLTLAPIDLRLVDVSLMSTDEIAWLNTYHDEVRTALTPLIDPATAAWLAEATRAVG